MAVKSRRRKVVRGTTTSTERHQIVGPDGEVLREVPYGEGQTLNLAQGMAERLYNDEVTLTVRVKTQFGEPDPLYRVVREEDGSVSTWRL